MIEKQWTKVDIFTSSEGIEPVSASLMGLGVNGFQILDGGELEDFLQRKAGYWDYYDENLLKMRDAETTVTLYLPENEQGGETLSAIRAELKRLKSLDTENEWGRLEIGLSGINEEDWAHSWKKYYHPVKIGKRLVICPSWEEYQPAPDEVVVRLDPGMAFGTGTHESTRLCLGLMEKHLTGKGEKVLDLGCGSGILAISAVMTGAGSASGLDIDEDAVRVANENAALNGVDDKCNFVRGNLESQMNGGFDIVFANLVADLIIGNADIIAGNLIDNGVLIASGIIDTREEDVVSALNGTGLSLIERAADGGWSALAYRRQNAGDMPRAE